MPPAKSVAWCATMGMAWQEFEKSVAKGPVLISGKEQISRDLSRMSETGLDPDHYLVAAGWAKDGAYERARQALRSRFPKAAPLEPREDTSQAMMVAHLEVAISFQLAFREAPEPLEFVDSKARKTRVKAFGIQKDHQGASATASRGQVGVLLSKGAEFALDLSTTSKPYQIIVARIERSETLHATWKSLKSRIDKHRPDSLRDTSILSVPKMCWKLQHEFSDLQGRQIVQPASLGGQFDRVVQSIHFTLDRRGVTLTSGAWGEWNNGGPDLRNPDHFLLDRPYLIALRRRGAENPFFLMWVDNAELMERL